jgi:hypothetical protein
MNYWNRFASSLFFALGVAAFYPIYERVAVAFLGKGPALDMYLLSSASLYLLGIARSPAKGLAAAAAAFAAGGLLTLGGVIGTQLAMALGLLIGFFRSGFLQRGDRNDFRRRLAREIVFIGGGLGLGFYLGRGAADPGALALWGFYLVQSSFFLLGGQAASDRESRTPGTDPDEFSKAVKRAKEVLAQSRKPVPGL